MSVSSINDHIKAPIGAVFVRAGVRQGWFVISYDVSGQRVEFFYNQMGREVFRVQKGILCRHRLFAALATIRGAVKRLIFPTH